MKSKIKSMKKTEKQLNLIFELDNDVVNNIEKIFKKLYPDFKLSEYPGKYKGKILNNFWELQKTGEDFNFSLNVKKDIVKFNLKTNIPGLIKKFSVAMEEYTGFSELSPVIKAKMERRKQFF
jgi:hypothetical protein